MSLNNKGTINNTSGVAQHTHTFDALVDTALDSTNDGDVLLSIGGTWVSQNALPYAVACGTVVISLDNGSYNSSTFPWSVGTATIDLTDATYGNGTESIFSETPVVLCSGGPTTILGPLVIQSNASATSITLRLSYYGSTSTANVTVSWLAIQMSNSVSKGKVTKDPSLG